MTETTSDKGERIAKRLARAGVCSRRDAEKLIGEGRVSVDGHILTTPATLVSDRSIIKVDGKLVGAPERTRMWRYHKPRGILTTNRDPQGRPTIYDHMPPGLPRVMSIGRLDYNSEGLLLLTNDGELARKLELPQTAWLRRYRVRAFGIIGPDEIEKLAKGMTISGIRYGAIEVQVDRDQGENIWLTMSLREGKNREIRRVLDALGLKVSRLIRTAYGPFQLGRLEPGEVEEVPNKVLIDQMGRNPGTAGMLTPGRPSSSPRATAEPHRPIIAPEITAGETTVSPAAKPAAASKPGRASDGRMDKPWSKPARPIAPPSGAPPVERQGPSRGAAPPVPRKAVTVILARSPKAKEPPAPLAPTPRADRPRPIIKTKPNADRRRKK